MDFLGRVGGGGGLGRGYDKNLFIGLLVGYLDCFYF